MTEATKTNSPTPMSDTIEAQRARLASQSARIAELESRERGLVAAQQAQVQRRDERIAELESILRRIVAIADRKGVVHGDGMLMEQARALLGGAK